MPTDSVDMTAEVKTLWQEVLRLLTAVLSHAEVEFILSDTAVSSLCQCVAETGQTSLKMSSLHAVPTIAKHLTAGRLNLPYLYLSASLVS